MMNMTQLIMTKMDLIIVLFLLKGLKIALKMLIVEMGVVKSQECHFKDLISRMDNKIKKRIIDFCQ